MLFGSTTDSTEKFDFRTNTGWRLFKQLEDLAPMLSFHLIIHRRSVFDFVAFGRYDSLHHSFRMDEMQVMLLKVQ